MQGKRFSRRQPAASARFRAFIEAERADFPGASADRDASPTRLNPTLA